MRRKKRNQGPQEVQALVNVTERRTGVWGFQRTDPYSQQGREDQQRWTEPEAGGLSFSGMEAGEAVRGPSCGSGDVGGRGRKELPGIPCFLPCPTTPSLQPASCCGADRWALNGLALRSCDHRTQVTSD